MAKLPRTGRLAPDTEALEYYNVPAKHWTNKEWDELDMDKLDVGFHLDPTPEGFQAADRRNLGGIMGANQVDETKDIRFHMGNALHVGEDVGMWDMPQHVHNPIRNALWDEHPAIAERLDARFPDSYMANIPMRASSQKGSPEAIEYYTNLRQFLKDEGYDTVSYPNAEEGLQAAVDKVVNSPEFLKEQQDMLEKVQDLRMQAARAEADGDDMLAEQLDLEATDLEDSYEYMIDDAERAAQQGNTSYIALDPGNVRSADAEFRKENIGKAKMRGQATVPMMAGSATLGALGTLAMGDDPLAIPAAALDVANRAGETFINDVLGGAQSLSNAIYDTRDVAPQVDFAPPTEAGTSLTEGLMTDLGRALNYGGVLGGPTGMDIIEGVGNAYNEYVKPYLSERQEMGLGGAGVSLASLLGFGKVDRTAGHLKRVGDVDSVNDLSYRLEGGDNLVPEQSVNPEDLIGRPYVSNMADNSAGDLKRITQIDDVDVDVERQGGFDYMRQKRNVEDGRLWASEAGAVSGIMNAAEEAMALPGAKGSPLMLPWGMSPNGSSDFAQFSADLAVQHARGKLDPALIRRIDERIRTGTGKGALAGVPEFKGIMEATPEYLTALGGKRKNVLAAIDEFRDEGALNASQVRHAVGDADATMGYRPAGVLRVGEIDMSRGMLDESRHNTYSRGVPGRYLGSLRPGASILDDPNAQLRSGINLRGKYGTPGAKLSSPQGKAMQSNVIGVLTEDIIEDWYRAGVFDR